jgi:hypothetical protein
MYPQQFCYTFYNTHVDSCPLLHLFHAAEWAWKTDSTSAGHKFPCFLSQVVGYCSGFVEGSSLAIWRSIIWYTIIKVELDAFISEFEC